MTLYVDTSALLKRYLDESDSAAFVQRLEADPEWVSVRVTYVEARRALAARLQGEALAAARARFERDWLTLAVIEVDTSLCAAAAAVVERRAVRSLDGLHLAAYDRIRDADPGLLTADRRQADAARSFGWPVLGA